MINPNLTGELIIHLKQDFKARLRQKLVVHRIDIRELHGMIIPFINSNGPCRMVDIASHCQVTPQSMATAINQLEEMGYLSRQPSRTDMRAKLLTLTESGRHLIAQLDATTLEVWKDYEAVVGKADLNHMLSTINQLLEAPLDSSKGT